MDRLPTVNLRCVVALCVLLAAAGCGQRGPLYLPGDPNQGRVVLPGEELPAGNEEEPAGTQDDGTEEPQQPDEPVGPKEPETTEGDEQ